MALMTTEEMNAQTGWTPKQRNHLRRLIRSGATIAYVVTDRHGRPANGGPCTREWQVRPGLVQRVCGPLVLCGPGALHGTYAPHQWRGERVWLAGFVGEVKTEDDKVGALQREIVGEIFPETALDDGAGLRVGRRDLAGADLAGADLTRVNLRRANLTRANLQGANLREVDLLCACLSMANLTRADLTRVNLTGTNLRRANLTMADLEGANLREVDLWGACLYRANLTRADLFEVDLSMVNLTRADLSGAYRPNANLVELGWENNEYGYLRKAGEH